MKYLISLFTLLSFLGMLLFFPVHAAKTPEPVQAEEIFAQLYRNFSIPAIEDFTAEFFVKVNRSTDSTVTNNEEDLIPFSQGRLFFKKPCKLRVESTLLYPPGLDGAGFIEIRDGKYVYAYKNGVDIPIGQSLDNPCKPSSYMPFGFQSPIERRDLKVMFMGTANSLGVKTYVLGLMDRTDPNHSILKVWVDAKHYFVRRTEWLDGAGKIVTVYQDPVELPNGYWIPMRMERYKSTGKGTQTVVTLSQIVVYSNVSVNSNLSDVLFQAPHLKLPSPFSNSLGVNQ